MKQMEIRLSLLQNPMQNLSEVNIKAIPQGPGNRKPKSQAHIPELYSNAIIQQQCRKQQIYFHTIHDAGKFFDFTRNNKERSLPSLKITEKCQSKTPQGEPGIFTLSAQ